MPSVFLPPEQTRLITIAAHVDHGKTTLADSLVAHNGLIGERLAGTLRYLDSDPEEQRRGITMRSSAIGLQHSYTAPPGKKKKTNEGGDDNNNNKKPPSDYIIHLVDSPGHTDFAWQVSSALTACDGCLLVVDAVEGMGPRTHQLFREVLTQQLVPMLVINKMDRLCTHLCLSPTEAYLRIRSLLETVNAAASAMMTSAQQREEAQQTTDHTNDGNGNSHDATKASSSSHSDKDDDARRAQQEALWTFAPAKGNVVFCSALFGWGFTTASLARSLYRQKVVPLKPGLLKPYLFGDYKMSATATDKVVRWKQGSNGSADDEGPLFAKYGLQPLWDVYENVAIAAASCGQGSSLFADGRGGGNSHDGQNTAGKSGNEKISASTIGMAEALQAMQEAATGEQAPPATADELQALLSRGGANTGEAVLRCILRRYRPLATAVLDVVCDYAPSPAEAASTMRSNVLTMQSPLYNSGSITCSSNVDALVALQEAVRTCDTSENAPCLAHVSKFFAVDKASIRDAKLDVQQDHVLLGLARVLSGRLRTGTSYHVLGPKHAAQTLSADSLPPPSPQRTIRLYLLMGNALVHVDEVPAGHLCAVYNLDDVQLKSATLSDRPEAMPIRSLPGGVRPLVKVNVEPVHAEDTEDLERGLIKLSLADAAVEVTATSKGERLLACLGELHLEQSILDLKKVYCSRPDMALRISDPIVDFGESTAWFEGETNDAAWNGPATGAPMRQSTIPPYNEEEGLHFAQHGRMRSLLSGRGAAMHLRVVPLAAKVRESLEEGHVVSGSEEDLLRLRRALRLRPLAKDATDASDSDSEAQAVLKILSDCMCSLGSNGNALMESPGLKHGWCVRGVEAELYVTRLDEKPEMNGDDSNARGSEDHDNEAEKEATPTGWKAYSELHSLIRQGTNNAKSEDNQCDADSAAQKVWNTEMKGSIVAGFQLATRSGPICEEPVRNILVVVEGVEVAVKKEGNEYKSATSISSGMVVSALRTGVRCALLTRPARLMEKYLRLTLNSSLAGIGALYSVLSRRRGKVLDDSMVDGTDLLLITALVPQAEAFGLTPELFGKTSGEVTAPEMVFSHWECLDVDPFWIPTTEEERDDFGELQMAGDSSTGMDNTALRYIRMVRERKGLMLDSSRTILGAEKQRTLKR